MPFGIPNYSVRYDLVKEHESAIAEEDIFSPAKQQSWEDLWRIDWQRNWQSSYDVSLSGKHKNLELPNPAKTSTPPTTIEASDYLQAPEILLDQEALDSINRLLINEKVPGNIRYFLAKKVCGTEKQPGFEENKKNQPLFSVCQGIAALNVSEQKKQFDQRSLNHIKQLLETDENSPTNISLKIKYILAKEVLYLKNKLNDDKNNIDENNKKLFVACQQVIAAYISTLLSHQTTESLLYSNHPILLQDDLEKAISLLPTITDKKTKNKLIKKICAAYQKGGEDFSTNKAKVYEYQAKLEVADQEDLDYIKTLFDQAPSETQYKLARTVSFLEKENTLRKNVNNEWFFGESCKIAIAESPSTDYTTQSVYQSAAWFQSIRLTTFRTERLVYNVDNRSILGPIDSLVTDGHYHDFSHAEMARIAFAEGMLSWTVYSAQFLFDLGVTIKTAWNPAENETHLSFGTRFWNNFTKEDRVDRVSNDLFWAIDNTLCFFADHIAPHIPSFAPNLTIIGYAYDLANDTRKLIRDLRKNEERMEKVEWELQACTKQERKLTDEIEKLRTAKRQLETKSCPPPSRTLKTTESTTAPISLSSNTIPTNLNPSGHQLESKSAALPSTDNSTKIARLEKRIQQKENELKAIQQRKAQLEATKRNLAAERKSIWKNRGFSVFLSTGLLVGTILIFATSVLTGGLSMMVAFGVLGFMVRCTRSYLAYKEKQESQKQLPAAIVARINPPPAAGQIKFPTAPLPSSNPVQTTPACRPTRALTA